VGQQSLIIPQQLNTLFVLQQSFSDCWSSQSI